MRARSQPRLGLPGIPVCAETVALATILILARETSARVHLCRLSSAAGWRELVQQAKRKAWPSPVMSLRRMCTLARWTSASSTPIAIWFRHCAACATDALRAGSRWHHRCHLLDHTPVDDDAKQVPFGEAEPARPDWSCFCR
jgi:dihydroorotase